MEWAPAECTLPTEERPLRATEFDELFASALRGLQRVGPTHLRLRLKNGAQTEEATRDLVARETGCCSFFAFVLTPGDDGLILDIEVPAVHAKVLDGLTARAIEAAPQVAS
ncbi:hypothetical protein [Streptosporangium sp. 'caverna']|uniref:hypothetical protein n=1 Tax=Streptosporangium sp. 'caverna' TaxID=2202249 RepID=UPI000D7E6564|nr:hypothetical protein [Streptosporangium sp. 'caverna']AWS40314.1 hypothetical protein DKM19_02155 [Streptosporangium sp. 'caverna']